MQSLQFIRPSRKFLPATVNRPVKLLLIWPAFPEGFWTFNWVFENVIRGRRAVNPPLGLATIAALSPREWEISIVDENVEPVDFEVDADIVAVGGMSVQYSRQLQIIKGFRERGHYVVAGGSFSTLCPERYQQHVDTVIAGEAELIWPKFCQDYMAARTLTMYIESGDVPLSASPLPRHDLIKWDKYLAGAVQFSRGCPFLCEFCDIIVMFSRKPRHKSFEQMEVELDALRSNGVRNVVFVDDNLFGHPAQCRKLMTFLIDYQRRRHYNFVFGGEITINVAGHGDVLDLMREANFAWLFIGIESPSTEALSETRKGQNLHMDLLEAVRTIYAHGIDIFGGFIVGFDADDISIFARQKDFIIDAGIVIAMVGMLMAPPRTPLYERMRKEGRLLPDDLQQGTALINAGLSTNIVPLRMTGEQLREGTVGLHKDLLDDRNIYLRLVNKLRYLQSPPNYHFDVREWWGIFSGLMVRGIIGGGPRRCFYFTVSVLHAMKRPLSFPRTIRTVITNWSYALALRDYVDRTLDVPATEPSSQAHQEVREHLHV